MQINQKEYVWYVCFTGKIETGWDYKEDAKDHIREDLNGKGKVYSKRYLQANGIEPDNNSNWLLIDELRDILKY